MAADEGFEDQWRKLLSKAISAKAAYEKAVFEDGGVQRSAIEMYKANLEVRRFSETEQQMKRLALTLSNGVRNNEIA